MEAMSQPGEKSAVARSRAQTLLASFKAVLGVTAVIPCCFFVHFPFLVDQALYYDWLLRLKHLPEDTLLTPLDLYGVPFGVMYGVQFALIGLPALTAAIGVWKNWAWGWWLAAAVLISQGLFLAANLGCLLLMGPFAFKAIGM